MSELLTDEDYIPFLILEIPQMLNYQLTPSSEFKRISNFEPELFLLKLSSSLKTILLEVIKRYISLIARVARESLATNGTSVRYSSMHQEIRVLELIFAKYSNLDPDFPIENYRDYLEESKNSYYEVYGDKVK